MPTCSLKTYCVSPTDPLPELAGSAALSPASMQLHDTFDWAERSRKGLLLFIDEADAFLGTLLHCCGGATCSGGWAAYASWVGAMCL